MRAPALDALLRELGDRERHSARDDIVRLAVRLRAHDACEYCLLPTTSQFHVEHVIQPALWSAYAAGLLREVTPQPERQGPDHVDNFAWCCPFCNLLKRQQAEHMAGRQRFRLFDPRRDRWSEHFLFTPDHLFVAGTTGIGRATEEALGFNDPKPAGHLQVRMAMVRAGLYPPRWARHWVARGAAAAG